MARILLLLPTTTYRTASFLAAARRLGAELTVACEEPSSLAALNPAGLLRLPFDDPRGAAERAARFAATYPIDAVVPVDDQATEAAAAICQQLGLPFHDPSAARAARNKYLMRCRLAHAGVRSPHFQLASCDDDPEDLARRIAYPSVIKPLELSASRGVMRVDHPAQMVRAIARLRPILQSQAADRTEPFAFLVEDFVPGQEVALEGLMRSGQLQTLALFDKPDPLNGPFFEETIYTTPSRLPVSVQEQIGCVARQAAQAIGLQEGAVHAELRINTEGVWVIEVAGRSIGGLCSRALRFGDMSLEDLILRSALPGPFEPPAREAPAAGVMMLPIPRAGTFRAARGQADAAAVPGVDEVRITARPGQFVAPPPEASSYLGFLFARGDSPELVEHALREAHRRLVFQIDPAD